MKCLPASKIPQAQGTVLHDCHAEIITIRAFNRFLIQECAILARDDSASSLWIKRTESAEMHESFQQPFTFREDVSINFYSSEAPCGDASMELTMLAQEDATPWERLPSATEPGLDSTRHPLKGRGFFSELGVVRRKPGISLLPPRGPTKLMMSSTSRCPSNAKQILH
jgi:tRNA-specific adenosine deaminase 1